LLIEVTDLKQEFFTFFLPRAKTLALDTKTNHVFTMTAEFGPPPANAQPGPAGRPARGPMIPGSFSILMVSK
jgi:hypothetical protein